MVRRYGLRDDQWERIEQLLPGREDTGRRDSKRQPAVRGGGDLPLPGGHSGGAICRSVLATGRTLTAVTGDGLKAASGKGFSSIWRKTPTTNMR